MTMWCYVVVLLSCLLNCVQSSHLSPRTNKYYQSFRLTRWTRTHVQQVLGAYKKHQLGDQSFEDRGGRLKDLPSLSTDFNDWLQLTDWDRLHAALMDMQVYRNKLEWKRNQLEQEEGELPSAELLRPTLPQRIKNIQLDLRDLMGHVSRQMRSMKTSGTQPTVPTPKTPTGPVNIPRTMWERNVEGLHHSQGSGPLPHQAGERLPAPGIENARL
ncbi:unnamed protein product, partial [Lampetra planeri]